MCNDDFGIKNRGKVALIRRALYGGKMAGHDYWVHMRACMKEVGFTSCQGDPDVWMQPAKKDDGTVVWEYFLLYTDDCLVISPRGRGEKILRNEIHPKFTLKEESIRPPDIYLGGKLRELTLKNGIKAWSFSSSQYVQAAVKNVKTYLKEKVKKFSPRAETPLGSNYRPELDFTPELPPEDAAYYQSLIGMLRWKVELGRVDICCEVSMMFPAWLCLGLVTWNNCIIYFCI